MQTLPQRLVLLGTGGTIAGSAARASDTVGYTAATLGVADLVRGLGDATGAALDVEQVAQVDSKDMDEAVWAALARRVAHHLARPEVAGIVITHGTDTLEETAWFLQRLLAPTRPVVLTAAMRPATAVSADGPANLLDALTLAREPGLRGVVAVLAGTVHGARDVRKVHPFRLDAFASGDAGALGVVEDGRWVAFRASTATAPLGLDLLPAEPADWPRVEILTSHAGASGRLVRALLAEAAPARVDGLVVAGTGNGRLHHALEAALLEAQAAGVRVLRTTRCGAGRVIGRDDDRLPDAADLTPAKARIEMLLELLAARRNARP